MIKKTVLLVSLFLVSSCSSSSKTATSAGVGTAIGAGVGAISGAAAGSPAAGIAIGAGVGAAAGAAFGSALDRIDSQKEDWKEVERKQDIILEKQKREIEDLKRQQRYDEEYLRSN